MISQLISLVTPAATRLVQMLPPQPQPGGAPQANPMEQLLAQLSDPVLPDPISAWPPAPGWWVLGALLLVTLVGSGWWLQHRQRTHAYRRAALKLLATLSDQAASPELAVAVNTLLKRTWISAGRSHRAQAGKLQGDYWKQVLAGSCNVSRLPFQQQKLLAALGEDAPYQRHFDFARSDLMAAARFWIRHHKPARVAANGGRR